MDELKCRLERCSSKGTLALKDGLEMARSFGITLNRVEQTALELGIMPARYDRNRTMISTADQLVLLRSTVAVVGCGGLGGYVVEELARLGVGCLQVIDDDVFQEHNLNRQIFCTTDTLGTAKAATAGARVAAINPAVTVVPLKERFTRENGKQLLGEANVVVDALDSVSSRLELAAVCKEMAVPLVHGSIGGWYGQLTTQMPGDGTVERIYAASHDGGGVEKLLGNPSFTPAVVASLQTAEVCKLLLGRGRSMAKRMWFINLLDMEIDGVEI